MNIIFLKKSIFVFAIICFPITTFCQQKITPLLQNYKTLPTSLSSFVKKGTVASFNKNIASQLLQNKQTSLNFSFQFENKEWEIVLEKANILTNSFFVTTGKSATEKYNFTNEALHYKGHIKGKPHSFAAVSILANKIVAVIADEAGNINISAINTPEALATNEHIIYRDADLLIKNEFECTANAIAGGNENPIPTYNTAAANTTATINPEPVDIYFEADYQTFLNNSSNVTNVVNYVTALFNVVNVLYENDSVNTRISAIKVWNTPDPYFSLTTTSSVLNAFAANMNTGFPGDLAHFLSQRSLGGGIAYVNVLCASNYYKTGVSGNLSNSFNTFPTYSWSAMVITHELGHNLGSQHTQWCGWPGGAIDNCYTTEGGCAAGPAPISGGTIMSYCHLTGYGINFTNGFGPLPGAKIRSYVRNNPCIFPAIYFETTSQTVTEESADVANGCLNYKLISTKLKIPYAPTQPVDVTLVPTPSATLNIGTNADIDISPLTFTLSATNLAQTINFKVYNDAIIENIESLTLNFNINANGGNAVKKTSSITDIVNIVSEDHKPDSTTNQILYYEPFDGVASGLGNFTQTVLYGAVSPNRWIISNSGDADFATKAAYISNNGNTFTYSSTGITDSTITRLETPSINANGFTNMHVSFLLKCKGEYTNSGATQGGSATFLDYGRVNYSIDNGNTWTILKDNIVEYNAKTLLDLTLPTIANNAPNLKIGFEWLNNASQTIAPAFIIDSLVINGTSTCAIQTLQHPSNSDDEYLGPYQTVHYYNPITKNIMATIENTSAFDFGCTKVELVRTGNGAAQAWGTLANNKISDKVYKITTTNTNASTPYNIKLYFTEAEINGWLAATGNTSADIKMVKTDADITQIPPALLPIYSSINSKVNFGTTTNTVVTAAYTGVSATAMYAIMKPTVVNSCSSNAILYNTNIIGSNYQWQIDNGSGYSNVTNNIIYTNANTSSLSITAAPSTFVGYKYRCLVTTTNGNVYSSEFTFKFIATWIGTVSKAWENPINWSCGTVPDDKTDVIINSGTPYTTELSSTTTIRSLTNNSATDLTIKSGANLTIKQ